MKLVVFPKYVEFSSICLNLEISKNFTGKICKRLVNGHFLVDADERKGRLKVLHEGRIADADLDQSQ